MTNKLSLIIFLFACLLPHTTGQDFEKTGYTFRRISPDGGFTYGSVNTIGEDKYGFIWFGTTHGLYSYNTTNVRKYINIPGDSTTIPGNLIRDIFCDNSGKLWIGTSSGLCFYDDAKDVFIKTAYKDRSGEFLGNDIRKIFAGNGQEIFLLSSTMLGKLNSETNLFQKIEMSNSSQEQFTFALHESGNRIWVGGGSGTVLLKDSSENNFRLFCRIRNESISKIYPDEQGIWIGYSWAGLDFVDYHGVLKKHYGSNPDDINRIHHNRVRDIYKDEAGRVWISTYKGISIIENGKVRNLVSQEVAGIPYSSVYEIFRDSKNGFWLGTWSGGLAYRSEYDNQFIQVERDLTDSNREDEFVSSFAEKNDGTIIIGTEFGKLNRLARNSNTMVNISFKTENGSNIENIKSLLYNDKTGILWIGTFLNGLWYKNNNEDVLRMVRILNEPRTSIYALEKSDSGLWIGTFGRGLYHYNPYTGNLKHYMTNPDDSNSISDNQIRALKMSRDGTLWIGTNGGLNHLNTSKGRFERFISRPGLINSLSNNEILSLQQDKKGDIWIGTSGGGINKYDQDKKLFESIQSTKGLIGNDVYSIQEDKKGILWISTENGISSLDPANKNIRNFYRENEIKGYQFNPGAGFHSSRGEILFGDTKGFILFEPDNIKTNPFPPKVILTSLSINNKPVDIHSKDTPLKNTIQTESELKLSYDQNSITFNFVANNFLLPEKNKFRYRLINYDKGWVEAGTQNYATYTKIPPGHYVFEVLACNNDNLWNEIPVKLKVTITPPLWFSIYACLFYILILAVVIYFIRKSVLERQRFKKELLLERLIHESEGQMHKMKLQFFTNISHEFRTPLTLIVSPVKQLLEKLGDDSAAKENLLVIQRNANRLLQLINQLIDIHKLDSGKTQLRARSIDLISFVRDVISYFELEAKDKNVQISFFPETENLVLLIDPEKADKIFFNILANAMKFTGENGTISIAIYTTHSDELVYDSYTLGEKINGNMVCIEFSDNGPGIHPDEIGLIFERFGQGKNHASSGTGLGLHMAYEYTCMHKGNISVKSKPGSGSTFTVSFPLETESEVKTIPVEEIETGIKIVAAENLQIENEELTGKSKTATILIIEDNYELRQYLKNLLIRKYRIVTAQNGKQGLDTALTIIPDLVISDVIMPQMDGFEVCGKIKSDIHTSHIPVILVTALYESEKQIGGFKTGADGYLTKPFDENVLLAMVENLILSRAKLREVFSVSDTDWANGMEMLSFDRNLIEKASALVEQHLNDKSFAVDNLASKLGISTSSLYRKLKVLTNQSPTEFIRYIRLKKALRLMHDGNNNLDEIGFAVGFNSHSYFTSSFKKQFGKTPSDYLNDLKIKKQSIRTI